MIGFAVLLLIIFATVAIFLASLITGKTARHLVNEIRFEFLYNLVGLQKLLEDVGMRKQNSRVADEIPKAAGKIALVTGGARGIGVEVVKWLVKSEVNVIIGCRNVKAGEKLLKKIRDEGVTTGESKAFQLDLNSLESIRCFAKTVKQHYPKIHLLFNNAGKMFGPYIESEDGHESQFAINYLGHFLLTHLLLPEIKAAGQENDHARIINVTSCAHIVGDINFKDINFKQEYIASAAYSQSKMAQVLFSNYLNSILRDENADVSVYAVHPGIVDTDLFNGTYMKAFTPTWLLKKLFKSPREGATSIMYAGLSKEIENKGGTYISNCQMIQAGDMTYAIDLQEKLFNFTNAILGITRFGEN